MHRRERRPDGGIVDDRRGCPAGPALASAVAGGRPRRAARLSRRGRTSARRTGDVRRRISGGGRGGEHGEQWARAAKVAEARRRLRRQDRGTRRDRERSVGTGEARGARNRDGAQACSRSVRTVPRPNALIPRSDNRRFACIMPQRRRACHRRRSRCLSSCGRALSARCRACAPFATFGRDSGRARSE